MSNQPSENNTRMNFEEYLDRYGELTYRNVGVSMLPLLRQGKDTFTLKKKGKERCQKYDVVLFKQTGNRYVLHRVVKVLEDGYDMLGDNCLNKECGVKEEDILGVAIRFCRSGREFTVDNGWYRLYSKVVVQTYPMRRFVKKSKITIRAIVRKVLSIH